MGIFTRMNDIVQANINAMLDKAEDPQKIIRLIVQEMEESLVELRSVAARNLAAKKDIERRMHNCQKQMNDWHEKAELALTREREDLARAALVQKDQHAQQHQRLQQELAQLDEAVQQLQEDSGRLQQKLKEAKAKQQSLMVRQQSATVRLKAKHQQEVHNVEDVIQRFESYEQRIDNLEAELEAYDMVNKPSNLASQFAELEGNDRLDSELEALKKKVSKEKKAA
ncbi:phage shock protein PspA [Aliiglaciecola sp. CAU 1673]|uniref:phage shock protein PspA n=1 Tax=Aliiglaciecola sp. CAU 1673 TaxID=3032595 RepID=UPI0023DAC85A|nr:phage shock protein PspA [Aliiglaciecola sp. CAU 1673]MDF2180322.1 phage shock protein PspA [Aliiglaciecola sp. CAU 1673]